MVLKRQLSRLIMVSFLSLMVAQLQTDFDDAKTKQETDKTNANQKLKDLGLTDDEIKAIKGIS